jgi:hypothetical protein
MQFPLDMNLPNSKKTVVIIKMEKHTRVQACMASFADPVP